MFNYLAETIVLIVKFDSIFQVSHFRSIWPQYMEAVKVAEQKINTKLTATQIFSLNDIGGLKGVLFKIDCIVAGQFIFQVNNTEKHFFFIKFLFIFIFIFMFIFSIIYVYSNRI